MSKLTEDIHRHDAGASQFSYYDIPRGTHAAIEENNQKIIDSWEESDMLKIIDGFSREMNGAREKKDDLSQTPIQGLKTFSSRITPSLYEGAVGQTLFSPIIMQNITESIPVLSFGRDSTSAGGKVEDNSRAGESKFVDLKLDEAMITTSDTRSDVWLAQTTPAVASRLWQQIHAVHDEALSKRIISDFDGITGQSAIGKGAWNMDTFADAEKDAIDKSLMQTDCLVSPAALNKMRKQTDFKSNEYFQSEMSWGMMSKAGGVKGPMGLTWHTSKYLEGEKAYIYNRNDCFVYGIMSGFNAVAEPWRDVKEQLSGLHVKTWYGSAVLDASRIQKIA